VQQRVREQECSNQSQARSAARQLRSWVLRRPEQEWEQRPEQQQRPAQVPERERRGPGQQQALGQTRRN
jgi:hypothetical protein